MDRRSDREIIQGFLDGDSSAFRELLTRFQPACLDKIELDHYRLWNERDEILDAAENRLLEWRHKHLEGEPRFKLDESIQKLAWRVTKQECEAAEGYRKRQKQAKATERLSPPPVHRADEGVRYRELQEVIESLGEEMSEVLQAEAERSEIGGRPLGERLGISEPAARKRLERARKALRLALSHVSSGDEEHKYTQAGEPLKGKEDDDDSE
jgi:hypothetical protein